MKTARCAAELPPAIARVGTSTQAAQFRIAKVSHSARHCTKASNFKFDFPEVLVSTPPDSSDSSKITSPLAKVLPSATRIQMTNSVVDILNSELPVYLQVPGLPERFVLLADTLLMVENTALPVHSQILAGSSPVFFDIFVTPLTSSKNENSKLIVPLASETLGNVCIALEYLYSRFANKKRPATFGDSLDEAEAVLAFAHKYGMQDILQECECCLVQAAIAGTLELDVSETAVTWLALAEDCGLSTLLAHIELHIIKFSDSNFWSLSDYTRETIPKDSLLRITRGMSYYIDQQAFGAPICESHVNLPTLILWQTNFGASACEGDGGNIDDS